MSRDSEKSKREMIDKVRKEIFGGAEDVSDEQIETILKMFNRANKVVKRRKLTTRNAETADDWIELAGKARTEKTRRKYLENAKKLEPDNLDLLLRIVLLEDKFDYEYLPDIEKILELGKKNLEKEKLYNESIGDFWLVLETRPYMRVYTAYLHILINCHMMKKAIAAAEDILRLNPDDNTGTRFILMSLYVCMEDKKNALKLMDRYPDAKDTIWFQYPLAYLYFKEENYAEAKKALKILVKNYPDFPDFVKAPMEFIEEHDNNNGYFSPYTVSEIVEMNKVSSFLWETAENFIAWLIRTFRNEKI